MNATSNWMAIVSLFCLLGVSLAMLISLSEGFRRHRVGVTATACWSILALVFFVLRALGDPLPKWLYASWLWPVGVMCGTWALWDVSRLARMYGTSTLMSAAEIARGFLHSPGTESAVWAKWAHGIPAAAWVKGKDGLMIAINRHYERSYGKPATAYAGDTDRAMWSSEVADEFAGNDAQVFKLGTPIVVKEPAPTWSDPTRTGMMLKFALRDSYGRIVGVGGIELTHQTCAESCGENQ